MLIKEIAKVSRANSDPRYYNNNRFVVFQLAVEKECCRVIMQVRENNSGARKLFDRLGGLTLQSWLTVWMYKPELEVFVDQPLNGKSKFCYLIANIAAV